MTPSSEEIAPNEAMAVREELQRIVGRFPGFEPEALKLQPAMVPVGLLQRTLAVLDVVVARA